MIKHKQDMSLMYLGIYKQFKINLMNHIQIIDYIVRVN